MRSLETGIGVFLAITATAVPVAAQRQAWHVHEARGIVTASHGVRAPGGVGYDATRERLIVLDRGSTRVLALSPFADPAGSIELASPIPVAHATIDRAGRQLVWVDESTHEAVRVGLDDRGLPEGEVARVRLPWVGPVRVAGIAVTEDGDLHVLDRLARRIHSIPRERWTGADANTAVASFALADVGPGELRGLAYDAHMERFFTLVLPAPRLVEFDRAGEVTATEDLSAIHLRDPGGIAMAPSGDPTDDPRAQSVYVADAMHAATHGAVIEIRIHRDLETGSSSTPGGNAGTATFTATHVRTVETSRWNPPSPDPSGIHWDATRQRLLIVDGEVEEMSIYDDANFFESSLTGTLLATAHTTRFSDEPVGITGSSTRVIISDDDVRRVFFVNVGGDGRVGGSDDTWTSLDTRSFGSDDPEGVAYDPATNSIFIADGVGEEVFVVRPGPDGQLGTSDDVETHWDTSRLDIHDPEALEFDPVRGTLFVMDSDGDAIVETSVSGTELNRVDISDIPLRSPAGLTLAPSSGNSNNRSFYIVCRGTDNDSDPDENDGTLTEVTTSFLTGTGGGGGGGEPPPGGGDFRVAGSSDDAEQRSSGSVVLGSSDLELTTDSGNVQTVGVRFRNVTVPKNAVVVDAWIQFAADESHSVATSLLIRGQAADNPATFTTASNNITSRARTTAGVSWSPSAWTAGAITSVQRSPSLRTIVQELVNRSGWASGNAMVFVITGTGTRAAVAYDGDPTEAAVLHIEVEEAATPNEAPVANAGPDQQITLPAGATLAGSATDDGEPGPLTFAWSTQSGPGAAMFGNASAASTSVTFPVAGVYVLRLTASDGSLSDTDDVTITVNPEPGGGGGGGGTSRRIATSSDDAEQGGSAGTVNLTSGDLELVTDGSKVQTVGMRFTNLGIAKNATITNAWIQFTADASGSAGTSLVIQGQASDHAPTFTTTANGISSRSRTTASVSWSPSAWTSGAAGAAQRTPNLAPIVQQLVNRAGWASGNAMAFIVTGTGLRSATSFDGGAGDAAVLHIETGGSGANQAPNVDAGPDRTITLPALASLDGTVSDDAQPNPTPQTVWSRTGGSGTGTVVFTNPNAVDTQASFTAAGTYLLRLTANDGALESWDEMTVHVNAAGGGSTGTIERRVAATNDDAEEDASGAMDINSSDLELVYDGSNQQVGLRFLNLTIPQGATITNAWVQFALDERQSVATSLRVYGQAADNPIVFASANRISVRPKTTQFVTWAPPAWTESVGTTGPNQRTPNLAPVIQEIVGRGGWTSGNPLVLIITGTGHRTARSFNGSAVQAPLLHVEYSTSTAGASQLTEVDRRIGSDTDE